MGFLKNLFLPLLRCRTNFFHMVLKLTLEKICFKHVRKSKGQISMHICAVSFSVSVILSRSIHLLESLTGIWAQYIIIMHQLFVTTNPVGLGDGQWG